MDHLCVSSRQVIRHKKEIRCATFISASAKIKIISILYFQYYSLICIRIMIRIVFIFQILCLCSAHFRLHIFTYIWHWRHFFGKVVWKYRNALLFFKTKVLEINIYIYCMLPGFGWVWISTFQVRSGSKFVLF